MDAQAPVIAPPETLAAHVAILIPCYNEAMTVGKVVADFRKAVPQATVYVYDNNSTDDTRLIASLAGDQPGIIRRVVIIDIDRGLRHGFTKVSDHFPHRHRLVVTGDEDGDMCCQRLWRRDHRGLGIHGLVLYTNISASKGTSQLVRAQ